MGKLQGKHAVITGGVRGIGAGIAIGMAREGADILIADLASGEGAEPTLSAIRELGRQAVYVPTDVSIEQQMKIMADRALETFGQVDILVNDAGIFTQSLLEDLPVADWDRVIAVNLRGTFLGIHYFLPGMLARRSGVIINIASQLGQIGGVEVAHYCASKAGIIGLTKALAREVSSRGVRVNAIAPGPILTDMMASETEDWKAAKLKELPIGRFGEVHEVVPTAVFLASDDASYYVGQTMGPNGGDVML